MVGNATKTLSEFLRRLTQEMADETLRDLSDPQLVEKAIAGCDVSVFQAIVLRHGTMVYGVCWRVLQHEHDAEDAFQATFLVLARKLSTVRKRASLASWLHGVARRIALKAQAQAAARRRHERQASVPEAVPADNPTPGEVRAVLDVELARLPEKWRLPLILCYLEGRTQDEAADHLGLSKGTLRNRLDQARRALASRLTQRGVVWPAVLSAVLLSDCIALAAPAPGLFASTVEAATGVAAGKTVAAAASVSVVALTEGVLKSMFLTKCKTAAAILLVLGAISFAGGLLT
jgi:RNA polymerase sigma factor (sigma-70 family)